MNWKKDFAKLVGKLAERVNILNLAAIFLLPLFFLLAILYVSNVNFINMLKWIYVNKGEFLLSYLLSFGIINLFYIFNKKIHVTSFFILTSIFSLAAYISRIKYMYRGEPLMPFDLKLGKEGMNIQQNFLNPNMFKVVLAVALILAGIILGLIFYPKDKKFKVSRIYIPVLSILLILSITYGKPVKMLPAFKIQEIVWDQGENYQKNGFLLGFDTNIKWLNVQKPKGYDKQKIDEIVKRIKQEKTSSGQKPNIIVIQSESFWDIGRLTNIKLSKDPLSFFHSLQKEYTSGNLIVPVFGGGTTNTEFQVLTGMTERFLPPGVMVYNQYLRSPMESVVTALKNSGYSATAVHSYWSWFYRRDEVFKHFGFDNFVSAEFFNNPQTTAFYIKDQEITDKILDVLHQGNDPKFIFAVTMENHGPYPVTGDYNANVVAEGNVSKQSLELIERYSDNLYNADNALKSLITEIEKENKPTVVVLYGDHLPNLGANFQAYKESGYYSGSMDAQQYKKIYSTPFVVWDNIGLEKESLDISANFLLPYVLDKIGIQGSTIMEYVKELYSKGIKVIPAEQYDSSFGVNENDLAELNLLQYDVMFGKRYLYGGNLPKDPENYYLGLGKIEIDSVSFNASNGKTVINVKGENFTQTSWININGKIFKADFKDDSNLSAELPKNYAGDKNTLNISINVKDTLGRVIATSNTFQAKINK